MDYTHIWVHRSAWYYPGENVFRSLWSSYFSLFKANQSNSKKSGKTSDPIGWAEFGFYFSAR